MRLARTLLLVLAASALVLSTRPASASPPETKKSSKGLTYSIRVPDGTAKGRAPLVVGLHGAGDTCQNFMGWLTEPASAFPKDAILLAPQALKNGAWDKEDLDPLVDLIREVKAEHQPTRTLGFGFSRGAFYLFMLAFSAPDAVQAALPHSGGLPMPVPDNEALKKVPFYVIHGDADNVCPLEGSEKAVAALEAAKIQAKLDKIPGLKHTVDWKAVQRGLEWTGKILDESDKTLDAEIVEKIKALEKSLAEKSWDAAADGFGALVRASRKHAAKIASLAKGQVTSANEKLALAAIEAAGRCGAEGVPVLKAVPPANEKLAPAAAAALGATGAPAAADVLLAYLKVKAEPVAVAAAESLGKLGDPAAAALVSGLAACEGQSAQADRKNAILEALKKITGQSFAKSKEWKKWLSDRAKEARK